MLRERKAQLDCSLHLYFNFIADSCQVLTRRGQTVLAPAIGSAVGMETVQIAHRLGASIAISTASTTEKTEQARADGYEHVIDLSKESLKDGVLRITGGKVVDIVVDGV